MVKHCIICGKELTGCQQKYCSFKCAHKSFRIGKSVTYINCDKKIERLYDLFKRKFYIVDDTRYSPSVCWKIRTFCYLSISILGFSLSGTARAIKKDHTTVLHHLKGVKEEEKNIAYDFLDNHLLKH